MRRRRSNPIGYRAWRLMPRAAWRDALEVGAIAVLMVAFLAEAMVVAAGLGAK